MATPTITSSDDVSSILILAPKQNAEYSRLALGLPRHGTCERVPQFCAAAQPS